MSIWWLIIAMAAVTYIPRYLPMALAGKLQVPPLLEQALNYVPIAVLSAIIAQAALIRDGQIAIQLSNYHALATLIAFLTALLTRNLSATILIGLISFAAMKLLLPL